MNILYISPVLIDKKNLDGVSKKILSQCRVLSSYNGVENVYLASYFEKGKYSIISTDFQTDIIYNKKSSKQLELFEIYPKLVNICKQLEISAVYFRIYSLSWASNKLFSKLNFMGVKIAVEIPTYPFWKEKWLDVINNVKAGKVGTGIKRTVSNIVHFWFAYRLKKTIHTIVTFSDVTNLWGIPVIGIANGYEFENIDIEKTLKDSREELNLIMVASIRRNHGADRVIKGLSKYYKDKPVRRVVFHIVGDGEAIPELKRLVRSLNNIDDYIVFHGFRTGIDLEQIYENADIGISAIGFHRLGVRYASPLKSKEYFSKGIPVVGTLAEHDILKSSSSQYYYAIDENETDVDIKAICSFYNDLKMKGWTNQTISKDSEKNFAWEIIMKPVYNILKESVG